MMVLNLVFLKPIISIHRNNGRMKALREFPGHPGLRENNHQIGRFHESLIDGYTAFVMHIRARDAGGDVSSI